MKKNNSSFSNNVMMVKVMSSVNYSMLFYNKLWIGLMYRANESVGFNSSFLVKEAFTLGYSFDYPINNLRLNNFGSHEILFSFDLRSKNRAFISPRYF